jgi:hypothetical protein
MIIDSMRTHGRNQWNPGENALEEYRRGEVENPELEFPM